MCDISKLKNKSRSSVNFNRIIDLKWIREESDTLFEKM